MPLPSDGSSRSQPTPTSDANPSSAYELESEIKQFTKRKDNLTTDSTKTSGENQGAKRAADPRKPPHFRLTSRKQQQHRKTLYSLAWSTDRHVEAEETADSGSCIEYQYLAVCGHNIVTIYEVEVSDPRGLFEVLQTYTDDNKEEQFFACAFAGRSKYIARVTKRKRRSKSKGRFRDGKHKAAFRSRKAEEVSPDCDHSCSSSSSSSSLGSDTISDAVPASQKAIGTSQNEAFSSPEGTFSLLLDPDECPAINYLCSVSNEENDVFGSARAPSCSFRGPQLLCVAGKCTQIKVIDPLQRRQIHSLRGHGNDIYDLQVSPGDEHLLLSASVDESIRLWNLGSFACVAIFAGQNGHTDAIISLSWHAMGDRFVSAGRDQSIRLWNLRDGKVTEALGASHKLNPSQNRQSFQPAIEQFPYFATKKIHRNYVDCVQFLGEMILSKSTYNILVLWLPILPEGSAPSNSSGAAAYSPPSDVMVLRTFDLNECTFWFVRFAMDPAGRLLAVGNINGEVDIWDLDSCNERPSQRLARVTKSNIRALAFSPDGKILVTCSDNAQVSKWTEW